MNNQTFYSCHWTDESGAPQGGYACAKGVHVLWQNGPLNGGEPNGAFVETLLRIAKDRLDHYQASPFNCEENEDALHFIEEALFAMARRTKRRTDAGVEGTLIPAPGDGRRFDPEAVSEVLASPEFTLTYPAALNLSDATREDDLLPSGDTPQEP